MDAWESFGHAASWLAEQNELRARITQIDSFEPADVSVVAGVDVSVSKDDDTDACAGVALLAYPSLEVLCVRVRRVQMTQPYIPGFLACREVRFLVDLLNEVRAEMPDLVPQLVLVDGNGVLHPRGIGLASHLGVLTGFPTIGVAKKFLVVSDMRRDVVMEKARADLIRAGDHILLTDSAGTTYGAALRSTDGAPNPVFVSVGTGISLATAVRMVASMCRYRVPEPVRVADSETRKMVRSFSHPLNKSGL